MQQVAHPIYLNRYAITQFTTNGRFGYIDGSPKSGTFNVIFGEHQASHSVGHGLADIGEPAQRIYIYKRSLSPERPLRGITL